MNASYGKPKEHELIMRFTRTFLSTAVKSNGSMRFAVMTSVMRISKESIFGLNNPNVFDVLSTGFDEMFGFTQAEVERLLIDNGYEDKIDEAREWYDGYRFGDADIYNPWSILNYIDEGCKPNPYWASTSGNSIVYDLVSKVDRQIWKNLETLCSGGPILGGFDDQIEYYDCDSIDSSIYSVMVATGYLTECPGGCRDVSIPNKEMHQLFISAILGRLGKQGKGDVFQLIHALACIDDE